MWIKTRASTVIFLLSSTHVQVRLATFEHHMKIAHLSLELIKKFGGEFITERMLWHETGLGRSGIKISDGVLLLPDKRIAIEVELTPKAPSD